MLISIANTLSTSTPSASGKIEKTQVTLSQPANAIAGEPPVLSDASLSKLDYVVASDEFRLARENSVRMLLALHLLYLRRFRKWSQVKLARKMHTSQSAVARMEGGEENFSADTVERAITALDGRFSVSISPKEMHFPSHFVAERLKLPHDFAATIKALLKTPPPPAGDPSTRKKEPKPVRTPVPKRSVHKRARQTSRRVTGKR